MALGPKRTKINMSMDLEVWKDFKAFAKTIHVPASRLAESMFRMASRAKKQTAETLIQDFVFSIIEADQTLIKEDKDKVKDMVVGKKEK